MVNWFYPAKIGGRMRFRVQMCVPVVAMAFLFGLAGVPAGAQDKQHVVSLGQLNDEDLAKLAERSRQAQNDFAAGRISDRDLLWIIVIALAIIVLAIALR